VVRSRRGVSWRQRDKEGRRISVEPLRRHAPSVPWRFCATSSALYSIRLAELCSRDFPRFDFGEPPSSRRSRTAESKWFGEREDASLKPSLNPHARTAIAFAKLTNGHVLPIIADGDASWNRSNSSRTHSAMFLNMGGELQPPNQNLKRCVCAVHASRFKRMNDAGTGARLIRQARQRNTMR
jgi:hypothetical protein